MSCERIRVHDFTRHSLIIFYLIFLTISYRFIIKFWLICFKFLSDKNYLSKNVETSTKIRGENKLTCCNDMKYTWLLLFANFIGGHAQKCAVIEFSHRCVRHNGRCTKSGNMTSRNINTLRRIIKCPFELHFGWIRIDNTFDLGILLFRHTINTWLVWGTSWCVYVFVCVCIIILLLF